MREVAEQLGAHLPIIFQDGVYGFNFRNIEIFRVPADPIAVINFKFAPVPLI